MKKIQFLLAVLLVVGIYSCGEDRPGGREAIEHSGTKEKDIRDYNLDVEKDVTSGRFPCDTIALQEYVLDEYPAGEYLVEFDRTTTYNIPRTAVLYYKDREGSQYIFGVIAKSKPGERYIEMKNVVGFESSYINLDSTKLGTAFFFLTLFECTGNSDFNVLWEAEIPIHGGFNSLKMKNWRAKNIKYIELNFEAGIISGHRNYNYFFVNGIRSKPHLMETYEGIVHKRTLANVNNDDYPDYYEYRFIDSTNYIAIRDSVPFYWNNKRNLYVTKFSSRWFRYY